MEKNPPTDRGITYRDAGVDIDAGDELVERIKPLVRRAQRPEVLAGIGGFCAPGGGPPGGKRPGPGSGAPRGGAKTRLAPHFRRPAKNWGGIVAKCAHHAL